MSEKLARLFHDTYERLAPKYGYETRKETRQFDPNTPNGKLMIAVTDEIEKNLYESTKENKYRENNNETKQGDMAQKG